MAVSTELFLAYGFSFLALGIVALIQPIDMRRLPVSRHFWVLGLFGLLHGVHELIDAYEAGRGAVGPDVKQAQAVLLLGSFVALLEFARRTALTVMPELSGLARRALGPGLHGVLGLAVAGLMLATSEPLVALQAGARYCFGLPGGLLAGVAILRIGVARPGAVRGLACALLLYGLTCAVVRAAPGGLPLPTEAGFAATFGVPVQLIRTGCALVAALSLFLLVRRTAAETLWRADETNDRVRAMAEDLERQVSERTAALRESEFRLREAERIARMGSWRSERGPKARLDWSDEALAIFGLSRYEFDGRNETFRRLVHPEDRARVLQVAYDAMETGRSYNCVHRIIRPDGQALTVREEAEPLFDDAGRVIGLQGVVQDVTEQVALEEGLRQAQKMQAVGQLTGGVAHDFNNLLAVILGNAELLSDELGEDHPLVAPILFACGRGADLTQRLLAFARQQPLRPQPVNLQALLDKMEPLLNRALGGSITIRREEAGGSCPVLADPGQVESALLNLAINARDAMPGGGTLTIRCECVDFDRDTLPADADLAPGFYGILSVSDTGTGMTAEVRERAFEPFFTTKDVGQGSGLGLPMVYGFAKQSGGHVAIETAEGQGTTVRLFLPQGPEPEAAPGDERATVAEGSLERILLIEDDHEIRQVAERMIAALGYRVTAVPDIAAARAWLSGGARVDLVLSDVVLPGGVNGPDFADELAARYPDLPVIFMSGNPTGAGGPNGTLAPGRIMLNKPFQKAQLAAALREALENRVPERG